MEFNKIAFISDFLYEFRNKLDDLENYIYDLRKNNTDEECLDNILMEIQKLLSLSSVMGFTKLEKIISLLNILFTDIKGERIKFSNDIIKFFIFISNKLRKTLALIEAGNSDDIENYDFILENLQRAIDDEPFLVEYKNSDLESEITSEKTVEKKDQSIRVGIKKIDEILQNFDKMIMREFRLKKLLYGLFDNDDTEFTQQNSRKIRQVRETIELIENLSF